MQAIRECPYKQLAGIGLGVDRLAMVLSGVDEIGKVNPFIIK